MHRAHSARPGLHRCVAACSSLRARGAPVEYLRFEDEGHNLTRQANRLAAYGAIARFLGASLDR